MGGKVEVVYFRRQPWETNEKEPVLAFYAAIINYYKLSGSKQHRCIISQFCKSKDWVGSPNSSAPVSKSRNKCEPVWLLSWGSGRKSVSTFIQVVGRIWSLELLGLRSPVPCRLSGGGCSRLLHADSIPWLVAPLIFKVSNSRSNFSHASNLSNLCFCLIFLLPAREVSLLLGTYVITLDPSR